MPEPLESGLAPGFLVAAPALRDPNFAGSLVLMAQHSPEGSLGFVVNRPAPISAGDVLRALDPALRERARATGRDGHPVLLAGPVQPDRLWVMWKPERVPAGADALRVTGALALAGSRDLLEAVVRSGDGPYQLLLGYAGWAPMQVEGEVAAGAWIPLRLHADLVFDVPFEERWPEAVRRLGLPPGGFTVSGGGAKA